MGRWGARSARVWGSILADATGFAGWAVDRDRTTRLYRRGLPASAGVVLGNGGVLYGTAAGTTNGGGVVFSLAPPSSAGGEWTYTVLAYLSDGSVGSGPGAVVIGAGGVLYGTTNAPPAGSVFSLTPPASQGGAWTYSNLYAFGDLGSGDGAQPSSPLVIGTGGVLYGVTNYGGYDVVGGGAGTIFSLAPPQSSGGAWTETVLYRFTNGTDGSFPVCVIRSRRGVLYGVSVVQGPPYNSAGDVWEFRP